jgi:hypothetical protein
VESSSPRRPSRVRGDAREDAITNTSAATSTARRYNDLESERRRYEEIKGVGGRKYIPDAQDLWSTKTKAPLVMSGEEADLSEDSSRNHPLELKSPLTLLGTESIKTVPGTTTKFLVRRRRGGGGNSPGVRTPPRSPSSTSNEDTTQPKPRVWKCHMCRRRPLDIDLQPKCACGHQRCSSCNTSSRVDSPRI